MAVELIENEDGSILRVHSIEPSDDVADPIDDARAADLHPASAVAAELRRDAEALLRRAVRKTKCGPA